MSPNIYVIGDTHFGHRKLADGVLRPWTTTDEMDRDMIQLWNSTVGKDDRVFHLGDFCINRRSLPIIKELNGRKVLIKGNHDVFRLSEYTGFEGGFENIEGSVVFVDCILTHIPVHEAQFARFKINVHGHTHRSVVRAYDEMWGDYDDDRYICVSAEQIEYKPKRLCDVLNPKG